jgi:hypothetical protein
MILELLNANPWRFAVGDDVFVANWPHYVVLDSQGTEWTLPQQCLSSKAIVL